MWISQFLSGLFCSIHICSILTFCDGHLMGLKISCLVFFFALWPQPLFTAVTRHTTNFDSPCYAKTTVLKNYLVSGDWSAPKLVR